MKTEELYFCSVTEDIVSDEFGNGIKTFGILLRSDDDEMIVSFDDLCTDSRKITVLSEVINLMLPEIKSIPEIIDDMLY